MEKHLIELLAAESPEERRILSGAAIDRKIYSAGEDFVVSEARLHGGRSAISVRTHTRFAPFPKHRHSYVEMMIVLDGRITHRIGDERIELGEGEILIMNKHISHSVEEAGSEDLGVNIIMSDGFVSTLTPELSGTVFAPLIKENGKAEGEAMYLHLSCKGRKKYENLIENLLFELTCDSPNTAIMARTVSLLLCCLSSDGGTHLGGSTREDKESRRAMEILSYIKDNYRTATLCELCERLYLTVPYLSKLIKERFGKSFKELVVEARLDKARALFLDTDMPIGEIIRSVGYENESYFHRIFRERYGVTPLAMRKTNEPKTPVPF